ncbi:aspartyl-phosphate phosphatase Spo0E family protein [Paenibacillus silvisoli]|uniref:aspartyl-phosphate phosphatase Spo0E family protein n=1 Tax=Paenibacillus silvisoli TaxID=3110539 RepID=UPI002803CE01|nr:aspartyl-phosphate phosphatase Spo0E family protein [Paenibacillus silvisoli]
MEDQSYRRLERLRGQLVAAAMRKDSFLDRDVIQLSQTLDQLIVKAQTEKSKAATARR